MDVAGVVEAVGATVTRFQPGDEVFGIGKGTFAEFTRVAENKLALKPTNLTFEQAAAVAISGLTALQGLRDRAITRDLEWGVRIDLVRSLGADRVIDYTRDDFAQGSERYDAILDIGGNASLARLRQVLAPAGTLVIAGGETDGRWLGGSDRQIRALVLSLFVSQKLATYVCRENHEDLIVLKELIESGKVTPAIDRTYPLSEAAKAVEYLKAGHARGKVVITVHTPSTDQ